MSGPIKLRRRPLEATAWLVTETNHDEIIAWINSIDPTFRARFEEFVPYKQKPIMAVRWWLRSYFEPIEMSDMGVAPPGEYIIHQPDGHVRSCGDGSWLMTNFEQIE